MGDAAADYAQLMTHRYTVLQRARDASRVTIPGLIPLEGQNEHTIYSQPYQSVGARGVANLASRLLLTTLPPSVPFFRLDIAQDVSRQLGNSLGDATEKLGAIGQVAYDMMEERVLRPVMAEGFRHLVIAGNVLLHIPDKDRPRMFRLDQYVVRRDNKGDFMQIVVRESVPRASLDPEQLAALNVDPRRAMDDDGNDGNQLNDDDETMVELYTCVERSADGKTAEWYQEIGGTEIPGTRGKAPYDACGWYPLRWLSIPGSDYGRSHVTEYIGDLLSLEDLSAAMVKFAAEAARIIHVVDPNSGIDIEELASAETGDYLHGYADRIKTLQLEKPADWQVINQLSERLEGRVSNAFLLRSSAIRNAERVTAEEVRMIAEELDTVLGGTYSVMAYELQLPLVRRFMHLGAKQGRFPKMPDAIKPIVTTGFDALGRAASVNTLRMFISDLANTLGPQGVMQIINGDELARRFGTGYNIPALADLIKSADQQQAEQQQAAQSQAAMAAAPHIAKGAVDAALQKNQ
jgi:hypothetical protein